MIGLKVKSKEAEETKVIAMEAINSVKKKEISVEEELVYKGKYDFLKILCLLFLFVWVVSLVYFIWSFAFAPAIQYTPPFDRFPIG